jgi:thiol-disulfide isomerase/thioredoxin
MADQAFAVHYCGAICIITAFVKSTNVLLAVVIAVILTAVGPTAATVLLPWNGGPRADFVLDNMAGGRTQLSEFRHHIVLLHFFATWCEPCRDEMTLLQSLSERHAGRPLAVVAVNVAEVKPRVERFFAAAPVSFPVLLDTDRSVARAWRVDALPTTIVLDARLEPILVAAGDVDWSHPDIDAKIMELVAKPVL